MKPHGYRPLKNSVLFLLIIFQARISYGEDLCRKLQSSWEKVHSYRCTYRAVTRYEGKETESLMIYSFEKSNKIRMDIEKPKKGAVLIYNPQVAPKVKVRPFPKLPFFILNYKLTDRAVSSDSGGTIENSHIGGRIESLCKELNGVPNLKKKEEGNRVELSGEDPFYRKIIYFDRNLLPGKIEKYNREGQVVECIEFKNIETNLNLNPDIFTKF